MEIEQIGDDTYRLGTRLRNGSWVPNSKGTLNHSDYIRDWLEANRPKERLVFCQMDKFWTEPK